MMSRRKAMGVGLDSEQLAAFLKPDPRCEIQNGAIVEKCNSDPDDINKNGTLGKVIAGHHINGVDEYYVIFENDHIKIELLEIEQIYQKMLGKVPIHMKLTVIEGRKIKEV